MMLTVNIGQVLATVRQGAFSCLTSVSMPVIHVLKVTSVDLEIEKENTFKRDTHESITWTT